MQPRLHLLSALFAIAIGFLAAVTPLSAQSRFPTPEAAVLAYIDGVARQDLDAVFAATAIEEMASGLDFASYIGWLGALTAQMPAPASDPFFIELNRAFYATQFAKQLQFLAYGLMTTSELLDNRIVMLDEAGAAEFAAGIDAKRLRGIAIVKIGAPNPAVLNSEANVFNQARTAASFGADEGTERIALIAFEGANYFVGFRLLRYGAEWKISSQTSPIAGGNVLGAPTKTTPQAFDAMLE